jgi:hypothetical protein
MNKRLSLLLLPLNRVLVWSRCGPARVERALAPLHLSPRSRRRRSPTIAVCGLPSSEGPVRSGEP